MTAFLNEDGVTSLTSEIKTLADGTYAPISHTHAAGDLPYVGTSWIGTTESAATAGSKHVQIFGNFYGPTEGSVYSIYFYHGTIVPSFTIEIGGLYYTVSLGHVDLSTTNALLLPAQSIVTFVYMYDRFEYVGATIAASGSIINPEGSKIWHCENSTSNPTASNKTVPINHFRLEKGATIGFKSVYEQLYSGGLTLTIQTTYWNTTYPVSVDGTATSSSNPLYWSAGDYLFFYFTGTSWEYLDIVPANLTVDTLTAQSIDTAALDASGTVSGDTFISSNDITAGGSVIGTQLSIAADASIGGELLLGDETTGHNIDSVLSSGTRYFTVYDSTGAPVWRFYMSYAGSLARQQYSNGTWGTAQYFIPRDSIASLFVTETCSATIGAVSASGTKWVTVTCSKTDYTLIGPMGWYINGAGQLTVYNLRKASATTCTIAFRNPTSSASSATATIEIYALFMRSSW